MLEGNITILVPSWRFHLTNAFRIQRSSSQKNKSTAAFVYLEATNITRATSEAKYLSKTIKNVINKAVLEETEEVCVRMLRENMKI